MTGKRIGYVRVSTVDQNPDRQLSGISLDKKFIEYASGTTIKRPQLESMMDYVREDDIVMVHSMDRLARNTRDLLSLVDVLIRRKVEIRFIKENLIFNGHESAISKLLLMMMASIAEFEHALIEERRNEGIAIAKAAGKYKGGKLKLDFTKLEILRQKLKTRDPKTKIAKDMGISRFTLYRYLERIKISESKVVII